MKETRKGKFDAKSDEGIFLGYCNKRKAYKCLNLATHKVIESAHVKIDEFVEKNEEQSSKEPKDYRNFIYFEPDSLPSIQHITPFESPKFGVSTELHPVSTEL